MVPLNGTPNEVQRTRREQLQGLYQAARRRVPEDRVERATRLADGFGWVVKFIGRALVLIGAIVLIAMGHLMAVLVLGSAGMALYLMKRDRFRVAAVPVAFLGILGILGWLSGIAAGGVTGDIDRGFVVGWLALLTVVFGLVYLAKRDVVVLVITLAILATCFLANLMLGFDFIGSVAEAMTLVVVILAGLLVLTMLAIGYSHGITVSAIVIGTYLSSWLLFGDPKGQSAVGLTVWQDGRFDQAAYGLWLLALAGVFAFWRAATEPAPEDEEPDDDPDDPDHPTEPLDDDFVAGLDEVAKEAWNGLTAEGRELVKELYDRLLKRQVTFLTENRFLKSTLDAIGLNERALRLAGFDAATFVTIASARFERDAVIKGVVSPSGSLDDDWQQKLDVTNDKLLEELSITPEVLKQAVETYGTTPVPQD